MRISDLGRYALGVCAAAMFAGCGGGSGTPLSPSPAGPTAERTHVRPAYSVLYSFKGGPGDGEDPLAGLINVNGTLYSTTASGGSAPCTGGGCGTIFTVTTSGGETLLHRFRKGKDGEYPSAGLLNINGTLYGTAPYGGKSGQGTVFAIITSGKETMLYNFPSGEGDGAYPQAGLINVNGTLYGTTYNGGANYIGTVFAITPSGKERVLHSFPSGSGDGQDPDAGLIDVNGTLYGTTRAGGVDDDGTVFSVTLSGTETVLHSFKGADGMFPEAGLINVNGRLYGTTYAGGTNCGSIDYCGTVFAITLSGKETVLHSFPSGSGDGSSPEAGLINIKGTLYGTTEFGGTCIGSIGCGTVFAITKSGGETVLHRFANYPSDGGYPSAGLINIKGTLYGTTSEGGANDDGTVFSLSP
jgi:uncharacterized repeat protein (TIGR03803 family)